MGKYRVETDGGVYEVETDDASSQAQPQSQPSPPKPPQGVLPYLGQVASGAKDLVKGTVQTAAQAGEAALNPTKIPEFVSGLASPQIEQGKKAGEAWKQGRYSEAAGHGMAAALPGVGPAAADIGEKLGAGDVTGAAAGATVLGGAMALPHLARQARRLRPPMPGDVDPHVASIRAWDMNKDPRILDQISNGEIKLTSGLSDLKQPFEKTHAAAPEKGYANESVLRSMPEAKQTNRAAWEAWMQRGEGQYRSGAPIVRATAEALKETVSDPRAAMVLEDAVRNYGRNLTPRELEALLNEKNAELKSFYSQSKEVQAAAERAGADTLKTKALLEAQARTIREMLYEMLDPESGGAGPREIQQRYGALKAIEEAANLKRTSIHAEHPLNIYERGANIHLDPRAMLKQQMGSSEWLIENAIRNTPDAGPLPMPQGQYPINPMQIGAGSIRMGPVPDASYVQGATGRYPYREERQLPPPGAEGMPPIINPRAMPPSGQRQFQRQLPPPAPGQPPVNIQPPYTGSGAIQAPPAGTAESIATKIGRQIWETLGGPKLE